jgi:5-enolpyruvylshikimate-3-phosphate synthase
MTKNFFVVVPYGMPILGAGMTDKLPFGKKAPTAASKQAKIEQFEEARSQLEQRISVVSQGLTRVGVRVARLGTEEIVELFYKLFNPGETDKPIIN